MKNILFAICIVTFLYSCSSDEKPYIENWMQDAIGTENTGKIGTIQWNDSTFYSMTGIKEKKLCIGFFKDKNYSDPIFIWTASEPFPDSYELNQGYDKKEKYNVTPYEVYLDVEDQNNFSGTITCIGIPEDPDKRHTQGYAEIFYYVFFVIEGKYKLINEALTAKNFLLYIPIRWYDKSVAVNGTLYTKEGKEYSLRFLSKKLIPVNLFEGIDTQIKTIKRVNILTGESIWESPINEDIDIPEENPPILSKTTINKNGNKWEFHLEIIYYNGDKETRVFITDIETGEVKRKNAVEHQ